MKAGKKTPGQRTKSKPVPVREDRLNRCLAAARGVSRREADRLICDGHVTLNGSVIREPGTRLDPQRDAIKIDGKRVSGKPVPVYYLLYKPRGVVCTMEDPEGRPCVGEFLNRVKGRPVPAGRLDFDSEGLILCTNDGDMIHRLIHPRHKVQKVYHVKVSGIPDLRAIQRLRTGIPLDGRKTLTAGVTRIRQGKRNSWLRISIQEGRNRQIKRMVEHIGLRVLKLRRVAMGPLRLTGLKPGEYRRLNLEEVRKLRLAVEADSSS
jgi:23S rRNA pseudouridine2605 synthase